MTRERVQRGAFSGMGEAMHAHRRMRRREHVRGAIGRAVVPDEDLDLHALLRLNRRDRVDDRRRLVERRDEDRQRRSSRRRLHRPMHLAPRHDGEDQAEPEIEPLDRERDMPPARDHGSTEAEHRLEPAARERGRDGNEKRGLPRREARARGRKRSRAQSRGQSATDPLLQLTDCDRSIEMSSANPSWRILPATSAKWLPVADATSTSRRPRSWWPRARRGRRRAGGPRRRARLAPALVDARRAPRRSSRPPGSSPSPWPSILPPGRPHFSPAASARPPGRTTKRPPSPATSGPFVESDRPAGPGGKHCPAS